MGIETVGGAPSFVREKVAPAGADVMALYSRGTP
jgi:hypothetical protein